MKYFWNCVSLDYLFKQLTLLFNNHPVGLIQKNCMKSIMKSDNWLSTTLRLKNTIWFIVSILC